MSHEVPQPELMALACRYGLELKHVPSHGDHVHWEHLPSMPAHNHIEDALPLVHGSLHYSGCAMDVKMPPRPPLIQASYFAQPMLKTPEAKWAARHGVVFRDMHPRAEGKLEGLTEAPPDTSWATMQPVAVRKMTLRERWDRWLLGGPWW